MLWDLAAATDTHILADLEMSGRDPQRVLESGEKLVLEAENKLMHNRRSVDVKKGEVCSAIVSVGSLEGERAYPTEEEKRILRKVAGPISWPGYMLCFIDGANNASYYGVTGVFANFIQRPLPPGGNGWVSIANDSQVIVAIICH